MAIVAAMATSVLGGRAAADPAASVAFTTPSSSGSTFTTSAITLAGTAGAPTGIVVEVDLSVRAGAGAVSETTLIPDTPNALFTWSWAPALTSNGTYTLTAVAVTAPTVGGAQSQTQASVDFVVDVAPQPPSGVTSSIDAGSRTATVTWSPNPEPDLTGYLILRAGPGATAGFAPINLVGAGDHTYTDTGVTSEPPGVYRYAVVAIRSGGFGARTDPSRQSAPTSVTFTTRALPATPKGWGHPTVVAPPARPVAGGRAAPRAATPSTSAPASSAPGAVAPAAAPAVSSTTPGSAPAAPAASAPAPARAAAGQGAGQQRVAVRSDARKTAFKVLDAVLLLSVLMLFVAVRRERRRRAAPSDALEPEPLFGELAMGAPITVGEALARRAAPPADGVGDRGPVSIAAARAWSDAGGATPSARVESPADRSAVALADLPQEWAAVGPHRGPGSEETQEPARPLRSPYRR